jgi:hypothetical protein
MYTQKAGYNDGNLISTAKNLVHAVFPAYDPHGDIYAYCSKWLTDGIKYGKIKCEFTPTPDPITIKEELLCVPYMVDLPEVKNNYKEYFNIKSEDLVIGWYGGINSFDGELNIARQVVIDIAKKRKDIKFIFMNQEAFCNEENTIFVEGTTDVEQKYVHPALLPPPQLPPPPPIATIEIDVTAAGATQVYVPAVKYD